MRGLFVTGTDTGIGKTVVSAALMAAAAPHVRYWKPVQTGASEDDDTTTVLELAGLSRERVLEAGERFELPASPHHAAAAEGARISVARLAALAAEHDRPDVRWVVEGAGGLMVPLSDTRLMPDLVRALELPVLLVSSTKLGTINHTLLSLAQLDHLGLPTRGVVLVGPRDESALSGIGSHHAAPILAEIPTLDELDRSTLLPVGRALLAARPIQEVLQ